MATVEVIFKQGSRVSDKTARESLKGFFSEAWVQALRPGDVATMDIPGGWRFLVVSREIFWKANIASKNEHGGWGFFATPERVVVYGREL